MTNETKTKAPVRIKLGRISAKIWENVAADGNVFYSISFSRTYKDDATGEFKESTSYSRDDLTCIAGLAAQVEEKIGELVTS